ncbi:guanylate cyclase 32E-like [Mercenaria mercenaria]|uniref:guanylate cyclase 32E-like n=1 Tax=Mercenaria mercenaria TaxID=6596 RepID=UPI00234E688A|nr:guanylate cyclase 32E-like [Mercenaria mercenaria]XP_053402249.1 guanylate cyclase 32E-like [Mercenaria mercenaria]
MESSKAIESCLFLLCNLLLAESKSVELIGAGASFPSAVYTQWMNDYRKYRIRHVDVQMQYYSIGSGGGKARIKGELLPAVHYAGSDITLTDDEKKAYPDLTTFPTMAGAIVLAYNIPGLGYLNLNLEAIVGIYNGTIRNWNSPEITILNKESTLPPKEIAVIVRADKSGTTRAFTSGLSSYSREWRTTYGTFSEGRNKNTRTSVKWNNNTVKFFGQGNHGMSGLIMSIDYSVGYVSIANAKSSGLQYARLVNDAGSLVNATVETVQNAIISANGSLDIMNTPGPFAYPLASFTYFIVPMSTMAECDAAVEFVRYVNWFYHTEVAQELLVRLHMVPLDNASISGVVNKVLKAMTCGGKNVWQLMISQTEAENKVNNNNNWQIPTFISLCLVIAVSTGLGVHLGRQQIYLHRELLKDTWKIDITKISLDKETVIEKMSSGRLSRNSSMKEDNLVHENIVFSHNCRTEQQNPIGVFGDQPVTLLKMTRHPIDFNLSEKKTLIWMRDTIKHVNIMQIFGVTKIDGRWNIVHRDIFLGSLSDILRSKRIEIHTEGIVALSKSLVKGLSYLHRKGIVHGHLTGMNCLIDTSWQLRIAAWIETKLETFSKIDKNKVSAFQSESEDDKTLLLWVAPEIIKFKRTPTQASDIYSLSMIFQEMFTRKQPYYELTMTNSEIIYAVLTCGIRPHFATETPTIFRSIMERSWEMDQAARPKLDTIYNSIKAAFPVEISFLDCVIRSVEHYARQLEEKNKDQEIELKIISEKARTYMYHSIPISVANALTTMSEMETEIKECACIIVYKVANITSLIKHVSAKGIVNLLNSFYVGTDQLFLENDIYKLNRYSGETILLVGLQRKFSNDFGIKVATDAAYVTLQLNTFARKFSKQRLVGTNTEIRLQTGLASGTVIVGLMGNVVPLYTAFGNVLEEASKLAGKAEPSEVRISETVHSSLKEAKVPGTYQYIKNGITCYSLDSQNSSIHDYRSIHPLTVSTSSR